MIINGNEKYQLESYMTVLQLDFSVVVFVVL